MSTKTGTELHLLFRTIRARDLVGVRAALANGADLTAHYGVSIPLAQAVQTGDLDIVRALLEAGADPGQRGHAGLTKSQQTMRIGWTPAAVAVALGHDAVLELFFERGLGADRGLGAVMAAVATGQYQTLDRLLFSGAPVHPLSRADRELVGTPLLLAAELGRVDCARVLLERGAAVDDCDGEGRTPLMVAASRGHAALCALLLERGANVHARDNADVQAIDLATGNEVRALLRGGRKPRAEARARGHE